jgi:hypothetical protein
VRSLFQLVLPLHPIQEESLPEVHFFHFWHFKATSINISSRQVFMNSAFGKRQVQLTIEAK